MQNLTETLYICYTIPTFLRKYTLFLIAVILAIGAGVFFLFFFSDIPYENYRRKETSSQNFLEQTATRKSTSTEVFQPTPFNPFQAATSSNRDIPEILYKKAITTYFWVGENATTENGFIPNAQSAWDEEWLERYGGVDDPNTRCGFLPCGFLPKENPFYFALPYSDFDGEGNRKSSALNIPWAAEVDSGVSLLKNRWIEIVQGSKTCYAQWEDVGPFETDDFEYVFEENDTPKNIFGLKAGLDVSPAVRDCLGLHGSGETQWRFVPETEVPPGPWKAIVTKNALRKL